MDLSTGYPDNQRPSKRFRSSNNCGETDPSSLSPPDSKEADFFSSTVKRLCQVLEVDTAIIGQLCQLDAGVILVLSAYGVIKNLQLVKYTVADSPCEQLLISGCPQLYNGTALELFPKAVKLQELQITSYFGVPLSDSNASPIGVLVVLSQLPFKNVDKIHEVCSATALKVATEVERVRTQQVLAYRLNVERALSSFSASSAASGWDEQHMQQGLESLAKAMFIDRASVHIVEGDECIMTHEWASEGLEPKHSLLRRLPVSCYPFDLEPLKGNSNLRAIPVAPLITDRLRPLDAPNVDEAVAQQLQANQVILCHVADNERVTGFVQIEVNSPTRTLSEEDVEAWSLFSVIVGLVQERMTIKRRLERAKAAANVARATKSEFVAKVSHELKTPLNGIIGYSDLLMESPLTPEQKEYVETTKACGELLLRVVDDIVDYGKAESGCLSLHPCVFNLRQTVCEFVDVLAQAAKKKDLQLLFEWDTSIPRIVKTDRVRLTQVLSNLGGNAVKFTEQGTIRISARLLSMEEHKARIQISFEDTGIGIDIEHMEKLFEPFTQADNSLTWSYKGFGVGLNLCKTIVALLGGDLWVESSPCSGSTFSFTFQTDIIPQSGESVHTCKKAAEQRENRYNPRVLIVDDNKMNRILLSRMIGKVNPRLAVFEACDGTQCLEMLRTEFFDVILMDINMPALDGFKTMECIQEIFPCKADRPKIIAITAGQEREKCLEAEMDDYLQKPVSLKELQTLLTSWLHLDAQGSRRWSTGSFPGTPTDSPLRVAPS